MSDEPLPTETECSAPTPVMDDEDFLAEIKCCITTQVMHDPYIAADGFSYEKAAIQAWFASTKGGSKTSPMTGSKLKSVRLVENKNLRKLIQKSKFKPEGPAPTFNQPTEDAAPVYTGDGVSTVIVPVEEEEPSDDESESQDTLDSSDSDFVTSDAETIHSTSSSSSESTISGSGDESRDEISSSSESSAYTEESSVMCELQEEESDSPRPKRRRSRRWLTNQMSSREADLPGMGEAEMAALLDQIELQLQMHETKLRNQAGRTRCLVDVMYAQHIAK
jgi:hypothetical protein